MTVETAAIRASVAAILAQCDAIDGAGYRTLNGNPAAYEADFVNGKYYQAGVDKGTISAFKTATGFTGSTSTGADGLVCGTTPLIATNDFSTWTKSNTTLTGNLLADNATNGFHELITTNTITAGAALGLAVEVKANTCTKGRLWFVNTATGFYTDFDLTAGTTSAATDFGGTTPLTSSITAIGSGWYRITVAGIPGSLTSGHFDILPRDNGISYAGTGKSFYVANARMENLAASALVQTTSAPTAVTRLIKAKIAPALPTDLYQVLHHTDNNTNTTNGYSDLEVYRDQAGNLILEVKKNSTTVPSGVINFGPISNSTSFTLAYTASASGIIASLNGATALTSSVTAWPTDLTYNRLNGNISAGRAWGGSIALDAVWYDTATASQLQTMGA